MENKIIRYGDMFDRLEKISGGKNHIVLIPIPPKLSFDALGGESVPIPNFIKVEEYEMVIFSDGTHGWRKK